MGSSADGKEKGGKSCGLIWIPALNWAVTVMYNLERLDTYTQKGESLIKMKKKCSPKHCK